MAAATVEGWSAVEYNHAHRRQRASPRSHELPHRRRVVAAEFRRRRLRLIDLALGLVLALVAIVLAPGLAIVALLALVGLLACGASLAYRRFSRRRDRRSLYTPGEH